MFKIIDVCFLLDEVLIDCVKIYKFYEQPLIADTVSFQSVLFSHLTQKTNSAMTPFTMSKKGDVYQCYMVQIYCEE